jgi:AraC-like DNA-binding protein
MLFFDARTIQMLTPIHAPTSQIDGMRNQLTEGLSAEALMDHGEGRTESSPSLLPRHGAQVVQHQAAIGGSLKKKPQDDDPSSSWGVQRAVADLLQAVSNAFRDTPAEAHECVSEVIAALRIDQDNSSLFSDGSRAAKVASAPRGGLAPWQARNLITYVDTHLDLAIDSVALAGLVKLSTSHFCRAFRDTFNDTPHTYVMRRRIEQAQGLMLQTNVSLAQIATECGLVDQAHLSKSFRRFVGESPGAWRRARAIVRQA